MASRRALARLGVAATLLGLAFTSTPAEATTPFSFNLQRPAVLPPTCAPNARGRVTIESLGFAERMTVEVSGLPPSTGLDLFTTQVPNFPFGIAWYVGDLETGADGRVRRAFIGRFSKETFAVAIGTAVAPRLHPTDARVNPTFAPIHTLHIGIWFDSPEAARRAGCPDIVTPFNGDHDAGIQVLSSRNFPDKGGPLRNVD